MTKKVDQTKSTMVTAYTGAKALADRTRQKIEEAPLSTIEKQWKKDRDALQRRINEGKMEAEGDHEGWQSVEK